MRLLTIYTLMLAFLYGCKKDNIVVGLSDDDMRLFSATNDTLNYVNATSDTLRFYLMADTVITPTDPQFPTTKGAQKIYTYHELRYTNNVGATLTLAVRHGLATYQWNNESCLLGYSAILGNPSTLTIDDATSTEPTVLQNYGGAGQIHPYAVQLHNGNNNTLNKIVVVPEIGMLDYTTKAGERWRLL